MIISNRDEYSVVVVRCFTLVWWLAYGGGNPNGWMYYNENYEEVYIREVYEDDDDDDEEEVKEEEEKKNAIDLYWESRCDLNLPEPLNGCSLKSEFFIVSTEFRFLTSQRSLNFLSLP